MSLRLKPRRINSIHYSFLVTLPKEFTDFHEIGKGDMVSVEIGDDQEGRSLILKPLKKEKQ